MKKPVLLLVFFALVCLVVSTVTMLANDKVIQTDRIPNAAQRFVSENFKNNDIIFAKVDMDFPQIIYQVRLDDFTQIEFDNKGGWNYIECERKGVPANLVPKTIATFVRLKCNNASIEKIEKTFFGYEIELSNGIELKFDKEGNLTYIDD